jgi:hypothetical protein
MWYIIWACGKFYGHLVYVMVIWYTCVMLIWSMLWSFDIHVLCSFGIVCGHLIYLYVLCSFGIVCGHLVYFSVVRHVITKNMASLVEAQQSNGSLWNGWQRRRHYFVHPVDIRMRTALCRRQGDQIWWILDFWAIVYFGKSYENSLIFGLLFNAVKCVYLFWQKVDWATFWVIFFSQTHLVTLAPSQTVFLCGPLFRRFP